MKTAAELLEELNTLDEHATIEAKLASETGSSLMETVCAFANEPHLGGGYILLGVAQAESSFWPIYEAVGVPNADQLQQDIASQCASMFNVPLRPQLAVERVGEKTVVVMYVPEAGAHEKPIHFKNQPLPQAARRRIGSTDQRCTDDDLVVFYQGRRGESFDEQVIADAVLDDLDDEAIELYRQLRRDVDAQAEELTWSREDLLEALGAAKRHEGRLKPTIAGVLLFGTSKALRRLFPMMRIDYIRVPGVQWVKDPDRRFDTIEIRSPLIRAIQRARSAILDDLPKAFSLPAGEVQGKEIPLLPDRVVREVVANAVMHRDYRVHGSIQIIRYANRLEVRNPGYSIKPEERLGQPGSETRNPRIAAVLHDVKFAETKGSGIRVMRELMAERDLSLPLLQSDRTGNSFMAMLLFHHFLSQEDWDWLESFRQHALSEDEMKAMISAREVGAIDNATYRDINRDSDTLAASRHLRKLCDCGLLQKKGQGPKTFYVPTNKALENWPPGKGQEGRGAEAKSTQLDTQSTADKPGEWDAELGKLGEKPGKLADKPPEFGIKSTQLDSKSTQLDPKSTQLDPKSTQLKSEADGVSELASGSSNELPFEIQKLISTMGRKGTQEAAFEAILALLSWRELSVSQLADYLGRTVKHVRRQYIVPLVQRGLIRPTRPDTPTDPRQTYRAVANEDAHDAC